MIEITPGLKGKTKYGTPVEVIKYSLAGTLDSLS